MRHIVQELGFIPMAGPRLEQYGSRPKVIHACEALMGLPASSDGKVKYAKLLSRPKYLAKSPLLVPGGGILTDQTGLGKTVLVLFFLT